jgi:small conductance mechanosensitive channel
MYLDQNYWKKNNYIIYIIMEYLQNIKIAVFKKIPNIVGSLFIFLIFLIVANIVRNSISNEPIIISDIINDESNYASKNLIQHQIGNLIYNIILFVGIIFVIINLGIDTTTIITILASMGLALGIAMQGTLSNFISGILISINNIFNIGDIIQINLLSNNTIIYGKIIDFNLYFTTIIDPNTKLVINVPNSIIENNLLTNISRSKLFEK